MTDNLIVFQEPKLEFRYDQKLSDPRRGLALFGPYDADSPSSPVSINHVVLGTSEGIEKFGTWSRAMHLPATAAPNGNDRLWAPYPGFEAAFNTQLPLQPVSTMEIDRDSLIKASRLKDPYERAFSVVNHYMGAFQKIIKLDEKIDVVVCVVPDEVYLNCRPQSHVTDATGIRISNRERIARKYGQTSLFEEFDPMQYWMSTDFRRQLKARSMEFNIPIQIIRETTFRAGNDNPFGERGLTPVSDRMWNLSTTLYYKAGGKPWRLVTARDGVCYIGIAFRRTDDASTACCAAQMFLNTGDGVVFLGEYGPWYSEKSRQFHLPKTAARNLLDGVLSTYRQLEGKELTEVFLHSRSDIGSEEFAGYQEACPPNVKLVGVRVRTERRQGMRLFRDGEMPVLRGTFWKLNDSSGLLWCTGFKPELGTYDGWDVPVPLKIDVQHGDAPVERVAQDIFGLTKLNYNSCHLGDSDPVTVGFSDAVGEILISNPKISERRPNFKFYI